jgi:hypothetical protein
MYKKIRDGVMRLEDGSFIPSDPKNRDWQEYQVWLSKGNTPTPERTLDEIKDRATTRITDARNTALASLTAPFDGDDWDADEATSARVANALTMIREATELGMPGVPTSIPWRTADNKDRTLTIDELRAMGASVFLAQQTVWGKQAALKNQIGAARTEAEVDAVVW